MRRKNLKSDGTQKSEITETSSCEELYKNEDILQLMRYIGINSEMNAIAI